jgi:dGTPase
VQLVSRIARNIGRVLGLNLDLIEAISLGHDLGHTPFGHAGERFLSEQYYQHTGRYFNHNVHSVRVLDTVFRRNLSLQTLDGILCHNGEFEMKEYRPQRNIDFGRFDDSMEQCYTCGKAAIDALVPSTLEGCVVRICDMIAYLGKDRQDARTAKIIDPQTQFAPLNIGAENAEIINNLVVDIIENSYGHDYIMLSRGAYNDLKTAKNENYEKIYKAPQVNDEYEKIIRPMVQQLYEKLLEDVKSGSTGTEIYRQHIMFVQGCCAHYSGGESYTDQRPDDIVVDYIASMTDDYFIALFQRLFPNSSLKIHYKSYFEEMDK